MIYPHQYSHLSNQPNHPRTVQQKPIPINNQPHSAIHFNHPHNSPSIHPHPINSQPRLTSYNPNLATNQVHIPQHQIYPPHNLSHSHHHSSHSHLNQSHSHRRNIAVQPDIAIPQAPAHLPPQTRVEYVPYEQRYIDYVEQRVRVPVQKVKTDYYQVEHVVDYVPVAKEEIVYVTQPQEAVNMRLQYIPVQQRIIHIKEQDAKHLRLNQTDSLHSNHNHIEHLPVTMNPVGNMPFTFNQAARDSFQFQLEKPVELKPSKTNYVTSEGYDPNQRIRQIDRVLAQSSQRQYRDMQQYQYGQPEQNRQSGLNILESIAGGVSNLIKKDTKFSGSGLSEHKQSNNQGENILKSLVAGLGNGIKHQNNHNLNDNYQNGNNQNTFGNWFNQNQFSSPNVQQEHNNIPTNNILSSLGDIIKKNSQNTSSNPEIDLSEVPQHKNWHKNPSYQQSINQADQHKQNGQQILGSIAGGLGGLIKGRPQSSSGSGNYYDNPLGNYYDQPHGN